VYKAFEVNHDMACTTPLSQAMLILRAGLSGQTRVPVVVRWAVETPHEGQQSRCMAFRVPPPRALCFASR